MENQYGDDFITLTDEDGKEYELEKLSEVEYNGASYLALVPADQSEEEELEVCILKKTVEDGEELLVTVDDEQELQAVYDLLMDLMYEEENAALDEGEKS